MIEEKAKVAEKVVAPVQATSDKKPKKSGCAKVLIVFGVIIFLYIMLQFLPFVFAFFGGNSDNSYIPSFIPKKSEVVQNDNATQPSTKKESAKPKTSSSSSQTTAPPPATTPTEEPTPTQPATSSGPQTTFTKQEQIDYFIKIAITDEHQNYAEIPLKRWTKNEVTVKYFGDPNAADTACADQTLSIINSLSNTTKFTKTTGGLYDIEVHFVPLTEIQQIGFFAGYMYYDLFSNGAISHAYAFSAKDGFDDAERCHFIRHEMTHTTGLTYNLTVTQGGYHYSIFNVPVEGWSDYINIDKELIKIMYNTGIPLKSSASSARSFLNSVSW